MRRLKIEYLIVENLRALIAARNLNEKDVAFAVGHSGPWISKILSYDRQIKLKDLDKLADFFGLTTSELVCHGISKLTERRRGERRSGHDRRGGGDRRGKVVTIPFPQRRPRGGDSEGVA